MGALTGRNPVHLRHVLQSRSQFEIQNPKQIQMTEIQMFRMLRVQVRGKANVPACVNVEGFEFWILHI